LRRDSVRKIRLHSLPHLARHGAKDFIVENRRFLLEGGANYCQALFSLGGDRSIVLRRRGYLNK
jgi:hypothetical protein